MTDTGIIEAVKGLSTDMGGLVSDYRKAQARSDERLKAVEDAIVQMQKSAQLGAAPVQGGVCEGTKSMIGYLRTGRAPEVTYDEKGVKSATVNDPPTGGYFAVPDFQRRVIERMYDLSPMRQICEVINVNGNISVLPYEVAPPTGNWVGETQKRDKVSDAKVGVAQIPVNEYVVKVAISNTLLEDSNLIGIEDYLINSASSAIDRDVGDAFVSGDGHNKPRGLYADEKLKTVKTGDASGVTIDSLYAAMAAVPNDALREARWTMSMATFLAFVKEFGTESGYVNMPMGDSFPPRIFGYPVTFIKAPDIAANNIVATFGAHRHAYKIVQRVGLQYQRDIYTGADDNLVYTRFRTRVGGQLVMPEAVVGIKVSA